MLKLPEVVLYSPNHHIRKTLASLVIRPYTHLVEEFSTFEELKHLPGFQKDLLIIDIIGQQDILLQLCSVQKYFRDTNILVIGHEENDQLVTHLEKLGEIEYISIQHSLKELNHYIKQVLLTN